MRRAHLASACVAVLMGSTALAACFFDKTVDDEAADGGRRDGSDPLADGAVGSETGADDGAAPDGEDFDADDDSGFGPDSGIDPNPGPLDGGRAFDFAPPYVATLGPSSRHDGGHNFPGNNPPTNPWRQRCVNCHKAGGTAAPRPFFAGGSVYFQADSGPAPMAEVRLKRYINANAVSAYTDSDGNWFVPLQAAVDADVNFSLRPGIRNATRVRTMGPSPAIGVCNQCHGGANYL